VAGEGPEEQRQKALRHINNEAKHPLGSIWDWCRRGNTKRGRYRRWRSAQWFAQGKMENPPPNYGPEKKAEWRERWNGCRKSYRRQKRKVYRRIHDNSDDVSGSGLVVTLDGKPCPSWLAKWLLNQRQSGWDGVLVSGYRTPEYSQQLCYQICGAPSCPGRCAGLSSNHTCRPSFKCYDGEGAVDVSYYWQIREGSGAYNNLGSSDPVHFSRSGY
jgi:hypothetical protein